MGFAVLPHPSWTAGIAMSAGLLDSVSLCCPASLKFEKLLPQALRLLGLQVHTTVPSRYVGPGIQPGPPRDPRPWRSVLASYTTVAGSSLFFIDFLF